MVFLAALLPLCFAAWLLWQSFNGSQDPSAASLPANGAPEPESSGQADPSSRPPDEIGRPSGGDGQGDEDGKNGKDDGEAAESGGKDGGSGKPLDGQVVVLDPGHNPGNRRHTEEINRQVDAGPLRKECDTTGTASNDGYPEASFTLDVARRARKVLSAQGAKVILTQDGDRPWGPCIDERARIGNEADADAAVSIHADGSASGNHGFHIIAPGSVRSGAADTRAITGPSRELGERLKKHFASATSLPPANYIGGGSGLTVRKDLGGLNLSKVPKVFIECGNMRNAAEAAKLRSPEWRQHAAEGIAEGISAFLVNGS